MEWNGVYERPLTVDEKVRVKTICEKYKNTGKKKVYLFGMDDDDASFLTALFSEILYDYITFRSIVYSYNGTITLQPEKAWSKMFSGVSPVTLTQLIEDDLYFRKDIDRKILRNHIVYTSALPSEE